MFPATLSITVPNAAALAALAAFLAKDKDAAAPAPKPAAAPAAAAGQNTAAAPAAAAPEKTASAPPPAAASAADTSPASTAATDTPVAYDQVKALILKLNTAKGRDALVAALGKFGVAKGPELKPEQYAEFVDHANQVIAGEVTA